MTRPASDMLSIKHLVWFRASRGDSQLFTPPSGSHRSGSSSPLLTNSNSIEDVTATAYTRDGYTSVEPTQLRVASLSWGCSLWKYSANFPYPLMQKGRGIQGLPTHMTCYVRRSLRTTIDHTQTWLIARGTPTPLHWSGGRLSLFRQ